MTPDKKVEIEFRHTELEDGLVFFEYVDFREISTSYPYIDISIAEMATDLDYITIGYPHVDDEGVYE